MFKKKIKNKGKLVVIATPWAPASEQFRRLHANINFLPAEQNIQSLVITSAASAEGKSWVAANLAVVYAQEGKKVLLVESDMRNPTFHEIFGIQPDRGISHVLKGQISLEEATEQTGVDNLSMLGCGPVPSNPAELIASEPMDHFMEMVKRNFDIIIYDSPPLLSVVDGQILANKCDGSILVVNAGVTDRTEAAKAKETIALSNGKLIGAVLNNF